MTVHASGFILYRRTGDGPRLLLLRDARNGHWGFAKGRRDDDDGDDALATARREVEEETGYVGLERVDGFRVEIGYVVRNDGTPYEKRVTYFLAEAPADEPRLSDEHDRCTWAALDEAVATLAFGQLQDLARSAVAAIPPA